MTKEDFLALEILAHLFCINKNIFKEPFNNDSQKHDVRYIIAIALCVFTVLILIFALLVRIKELKKPATPQLTIKEQQQERLFSTIATNTYSRREKDLQEILVRAVEIFNESTKNKYHTDFENKRCIVYATVFLEVPSYHEAYFSVSFDILIKRTANAPWQQMNYACYLYHPNHLAGRYDLSPKSVLKDKTEEFFLFTNPDTTTFIDLGIAEGSSLYWDPACRKWQFEDILSQRQNNVLFYTFERTQDLYYKDSHSFCYKLSDVLI